MNILVSACLLGVACRYDGKSKEVERIKKLLSKYNLIPICPEQLGGFPHLEFLQKDVRIRLLIARWKM